MSEEARTELIEKVAAIVEARVLWAVIPAQRALGLSGRDGLAKIVGWAAHNVSEDVEQVLANYEVKRRRRKQ